MYSAVVSPTNPGCILLLLDRSAAMGEPWVGAEGVTKAQGAAEAVNRMLVSLIWRCTGVNGVRPVYEIGVTGYGAAVESGFSGPLAGRAFVPMDELAERPARVDERRQKVTGSAGIAAEEVLKSPVWVEPAAGGGALMCAALGLAHTLLKEWCGNHPAAFPPVVLNLFAGDATDGDPTGPAAALQALTTGDGNVLLFNCHISAERGAQVLFPAGERALPDELARRVYRLSSPLPPALVRAVRAEGARATAQSRGCAVNANRSDLFRFLVALTRL